MKGSTVVAQAVENMVSVVFLGVGYLVSHLSYESTELVDEHFSQSGYVINHDGVARWVIRVGFDVLGHETRR